VEFHLVVVGRHGLSELILNGRMEEYDYVIEAPRVLDFVTHSGHPAKRLEETAGLYPKESGLIVVTLSPSYYSLGH
jgi:hypothetical protein